MLGAISMQVGGDIVISPTGKFIKGSGGDIVMNGLALTPPNTAQAIQDATAGLQDLGNVFIANANVAPATDVKVTNIEIGPASTLACDPVSAFGGIVALNRPVTAAAAEALAPVFTEVVVAPAYDPAALATLTAKKNVRVLEAAPPSPIPFDVRPIDGGLLVQRPDPVTVDRHAWRVVTKVEPTHDQLADLELAWIVCAAVSSNAIVLAKDLQAFGIGAQREGAVHAHTRKAVAAGAPPDAIRHAAYLALPTIGFPGMMAALSWVNDILDAGEGGTGL